VKAHPEVVEFYKSFSATTSRMAVTASPQKGMKYTYLLLTNLSAVSTANVNIFPFIAEYATSSRSKCKNCNINIEKDSIRLGKLIKSKTFDGHYPIWFHIPCFFAKNQFQHATQTGQIQGFESLKPEDQEMLIVKHKLKKTKPSFDTWVQHRHSSSSAQQTDGVATLLQKQQQVQTHIEVKGQPIDEDEDTDTTSKRFVSVIMDDDEDLVNTTLKSPQKIAPVKSANGIRNTKPNFINKPTPAPTQLLQKATTESDVFAIPKSRTPQTPDELAKEAAARKRFEEREQKYN
jgi:hypothetical protein